MSTNRTRSKPIRFSSSKLKMLVFRSYSVLVESLQWLYRLVNVYLYADSPWRLEISTNCIFSNV